MQYLYIPDPINTEDVKRWIESDAEETFDSFKWERSEGYKTSLEAIADEKSAGRFTYPHDALTLIAYYGWSDHARGVDWEDSASYNYSLDVYERAKQMLEVEGYDVSDL